MERKRDDVQDRPSQVGFAANQVDPDDMLPNANVPDVDGRGSVTGDRTGDAAHAQDG